MHGFILRTLSALLTLIFFFVPFYAGARQLELGPRLSYWEDSGGEETNMGRRISCNYMIAKGDDTEEEEENGENPPQNSQYTPKHDPMRYVIIRQEYPKNSLDYIKDPPSEWEEWTGVDYKLDEKYIYNYGHPTSNKIKTVSEYPVDHKARIYIEFDRDYIVYQGVEGTLSINAFLIPADPREAERPIPVENYTYYNRNATGSNVVNFGSGVSTIKPSDSFKTMDEIIADLEKVQKKTDEIIEEIEDAIEEKSKGDEKKSMAEIIKEKIGEKEKGSIKNISSEIRSLLDSSFCRAKNLRGELNYYAMDFDLAYMLPFAYKELDRKNDSNSNYDAYYPVLSNNEIPGSRYKIDHKDFIGLGNSFESVTNSLVADENYKYKSDDDFYDLVIENKKVELPSAKGIMLRLKYIQSYWSRIDNKISDDDIKYGSLRKDIIGFRSVSSPEIIKPLIDDVKQVVSVTKIDDGRIYLSDVKNLEHGDKIIITVTNQTEDDDPKRFTKILRVTDFGWYHTEEMSLIFVKTLGYDKEYQEKGSTINFNLDDTWQAAPGGSVVLRYRSPYDSPWIDFFIPGIGLNLSLLDFDPDSDFELGAGVLGTMFNNTLVFGTGWNLSVPDTPPYYFIGLNFMSGIDTFDAYRSGVLERSASAP